MVVPSRHRSDCSLYFTTDLTDLTDRVLHGVRQKPEKPLGEDGGHCPRLLKVVPSGTGVLVVCILPRI